MSDRHRYGGCAMIIKIKQLIYTAVAFLVPEKSAPPVAETQTEFDFECPAAPVSGTKHATGRIHLNPAEKDPARLLAILECAFAEAPSHLTIELIGPGILLHDNALMLFEEIRNRPAHTHLHIRARTCLVDGAILLWLAGDTRSMRADGWIQLSPIPDAPPGRGEGNRGGSIVIEDEEPSHTDLRSVIRHIDEWLPVREISGLRLFEAELREFGLLDDAQNQEQLASYFQMEPIAATATCAPGQAPD